MQKVVIFPRSRALANEIQTRLYNRRLADSPEPFFSNTPLGKLVQGMEMLESMSDSDLAIHSANNRNWESIEQMLPVPSTGAFRRKVHFRTMTEGYYMGSIFSDKDQSALFTPYFDSLARFRERFGDSAIRQLPKTFPLFSLFSGELLECALKKDYELFKVRIWDIHSSSGRINDAAIILNYIAESVQPENVLPFLESLEKPWPEMGFCSSRDKTIKFASAIKSGSVPELLELVAELRQTVKEEEAEREQARIEKSGKVKARKEAKETYRQTILALGNEPAMLTLFELLRDAKRPMNPGREETEKEFRIASNSEPTSGIVVTTCMALACCEAGKAFKMLADRYKGAKAGMLKRLSLRNYWEGCTSREELDAEFDAYGVKTMELDENWAKIRIIGLNVNETISREGIDASISSHLRAMRFVRSQIAIELWHRYEEMTTGIRVGTTLSTWDVMGFRKP